ncbi:MAG TPA: hypothetical protein VF601_10140 [Beijerinckiaceae bacterium]|jgi:hypothetical protein
MAERKQTKIRYDDFIGNIQPDPAKPEPTIMLSGFVGRGGGEGAVRIYPDPSLGTWYDVPETDIVHTLPIPDSKLGGSHVWVRASAQIKPGAAAAAAQPAPAAQPAVGITPQPTPATHCFICPPPTQNCTPATICTLHGHCPQPPTPATMCLICPPHQTLATLCTQLCTYPGLGCPPPGFTQPVVCGVLPPSFGCAQGAAGVAGAADARLAPGQGTLGPTGTFGCTVWHCPTLQTNWWECHTRAPGCTIHICLQAGAMAPAAAAVGPANTVATVCTQPPGCPPHTVHNSLCICPTPSAVHQCGQAPLTPATVCTQLGCTFVGCTPHCPGGGGVTPATVCTIPNCFPTHFVICQTPRTGVFNPFGG